MSECKENVIEMIDRAIKTNNNTSACVCIYPGGDENLCNHCTINLALKTSRACIVTSVDKISVMQTNFIGIQKEIEIKLKKLLEES